MSLLLTQAIINVLSNALVTSPPPPPFNNPELTVGLQSTSIRPRAIYDEEQPVLPGIYIARQGGGSHGIIGGWEDPMMVLTCYHRGLESETEALYWWVSGQINMNRYGLTAAMQAITPGSKCGRFIRAFQSSCLWDHDIRARYVIARYYAKIIDASDLRREFGRAS